MTTRLGVLAQVRLKLPVMFFLLLAPAGLCIHAIAQETPSPYGAKFSEVCPDRQLFPYPTAPGLRNSYVNPWQQDYPAIVFDAKDGTSYWLDYGTPTNPGGLVRLDSFFTPVSYTAEKLLVFVCGLHFNAKASAVPTTQTIPDGGPQVDQSAAAGGAPNIIVSNSSFSQPVEQNQAVVALDGGRTQQRNQPENQQANQSPSCLDLDKEATEAHESYQDAETEMQRVQVASGLLDKSAFSFESIEQAIKGATPDKTSEYPHNMIAFQSSLSTVQNLAARLSTLISSWNAFLTSKDFTDAWSSLSKANDKVTSALGDYGAATCPVDAATKATRLLDADQTDFNDRMSKLKSASDHLQNARANLLAAYNQLDNWYTSSSVSTVLILPPVTANSLTQVVVQVTDPWIPLVPAAMNIASVKPVKTPPKTETVITIDRTNAKKPTITVAGGSGSNSTVTTTATDNSGKPVVSVQVTQSGGVAGSTATPMGSAGTGATSSPTSTPSATPNASTTTPPPPSAPSPAQNANAPVVAASTAPDATYLIARHRWVNFVPSAGLLVTRFNAPSYNVEALPLTTNTTTTTTNTTCATAPCVPTVTITSVSSTANFAYSSPSGNLQQTAIAGITWYPLGRDTYSVTHISRSGRPEVDTYAAHSWLSRLGVFGGTSVASLGTFAIAPTFEVKPGIELFTGLTLTTKTSLAQGVIPCASVGSSPINEPAVTYSSPPPPGTPITTTTVNVQLITGCATANATMLGGTTVPTQTALVPAFSFGFLLNANLLQFLNF